MNLTNTRPLPFTNTSNPSVVGSFFASRLVTVILHTKLCPGRRARSASRTISAASSASAGVAMQTTIATTITSAPIRRPSAGFARAILLLGGGTEERAARRATTIGRGAKPPSEVLDMAQRLHDIHARRAPRGVDRGEGGRDEREAECLHEHVRHDEDLDQEAARR